MQPIPQEAPVNQQPLQDHKDKKPSPQNKQDKVELPQSKEEDDLAVHEENGGADVDAMLDVEVRQKRAQMRAKQAMEQEKNSTGFKIEVTSLAPISDEEQSPQNLDQLEKAAQQKEAEEERQKEKEMEKKRMEEVERRKEREEEREREQREKEEKMRLEAQQQQAEKIRKEREELEKQVIA